MPVLFLDLSFGEERHDLRGCRIEPDDIQHASVVRIGNGELIGLHADDDQFRVGLVHCLTVVFQRLGRMHLAEPCFTVGVDDEDIDVF